MGPERYDVAVVGGGAAGLAAALEAAGARPALVAGHADNIKITVPEDLALARFYLRAQEEEGLAWQFV